MLKPDKLIRSNRRSLSITIDRDGQMIVHAPKRMGIDEIQSFIREKENWIIKKQNAIRSTTRENNALLNLSEIQYLGKRYRVLDIKGIKEIMLGDREIVIPKCEDVGEKSRILAKWISKKTATILDSRVEYFANILQLDYNSIKPTRARAKWGSCSKDGDLRFNYRLAMLSPAEIDYIIVHELCHLLEFNHSKKFYHLVSIVIPNYKKLMKSIKGQGYLLSLF